MSERLHLIKPINPFRPTQAFGENRTCVSIDGSSFKTVVSGTDCPQEFESLYARYGMRGHNGIDANAHHGQPVYAATEGVVQKIENEPQRGVGVEIASEKKYIFDGESKARYAITRYWHLKTDSVKVAVGEYVKPGQLIALADNTGASSGDHLHFELKIGKRKLGSKRVQAICKRNGYLGAIDPAPYLD